MHQDKTRIFGQLEESEADVAQQPFTRLKTQSKPNTHSAALHLDQEWLHIRQRVERHSSEVVRELIDKKAKILGQELINSESILCIIRMQQNQQEDLDRLVERLKETIEQEKYRKKKEQEQPVNPVDLCSHSDIRQIFLRLEEVNFEHAILPDSDRQRKNVSVIITTKIVMLTPKDLQELDRTFQMMRRQKVLRHARLKLIVATPYDLSDYELLGLKVNVAYSELYNPKAIFCRFFLRVLSDETLAIYPPKEALQLVRQFDLYPLVYQEGVRRLIFLANTQHIRKLKFRPVRISSLIAGLMRAMIRQDELSEQQEAKLHQRLLLAIVDEEEEFRIPALIVDSYFPSQSNTIDDAAVRLLEEFKKYPDTARLVNGSCPIGKLRQQVTYAKGRKNDRVTQLEVPRSVEGKDVMLGHQLNKLIKTITADIREQGKSLGWQQYQFEERLWPDTTQMAVRSAEHSNLNRVLQYSRQCIQKRHKETLLDSGLDTKEYAFYMSALDYLGLVEFSKKQIEPTYFNQVFAKTTFRNG